MKKHITVLLLLSLLVSTLSACSTENTETDTAITDTQPETVEETKETTAEEYRASIADELPENDFDGRTFIVLGSGYQDGDRHIRVEEMTGEVVNDAVYNRNVAIDERFNAKIDFHSTGTNWNSYGEVETMIKNSVNAGDSETFHLASFHVVAAGGIAAQGYLMNWYDIPYVQFEKPWWSDSTVEDLSVNDHCFLAIGDMALTSISQTYCVIFDKEAALDYGLADVYDTIREGKWTADVMNEICSTVYQDLDGDGTMSEKDYYGLASGAGSNMNTYLWAYDNKIFTKNNAGTMDFTYYSEHLVNTFDKVYTLFKETPGVWAPVDGGQAAGILQFQNYGALFSNALLMYAPTYLAEFEHEYGIIPYPKYDQSQQKYKTMVDGGHEAMAIAKNAVDFTFVGTLTEVLCAESYKSVVPAYYDVCLKQRYASSPEDAEMIELCVNSRVFDFGYVYDNWKGVSFYMQGLINEGNKDITSHFRKNETAVKTYYDKVLALFTEE